MLKAALQRSTRALSTTPMPQDQSKLRDLMNKFKDPTSPFYLAQAGGEVGPASPDDHTVARALPGQEGAAAGWVRPPPSYPDRTGLQPHMSAQYDRARATANEWFDSNGFDPEGRVEVPVLWGDQDMFRHVNNVNYLRWMEAQRLRWFENLGADIGTDTAKDWTGGTGTGIILKDQYIRYRHAVTWPDAVLWAAKPHSVNAERGEFKLAHAAWSLKDNRLCATTDSTIVLFDHDNVKRGKMTEKVRETLERRAKL
ncbi:hypothetical protein Q8F55_005642 [Vanrija albida]|uniref:Thioesterase domain-containing protein n=1 Tax=Vanrija albida TaxID=181172 RepID=A0ABR3Q380_9TREE